MKGHVSDGSAPLVERRREFQLGRRNASALTQTPK
jgi:hypothetical protein